MEDFTVNEMLEMQRKLQKEYQDWWQPNCPENGKDKLLWMIGEVGEVIDVVKKNGTQRVVEDAQVRAHFVEEMADVLMFYSDVLLCYGITADELKQVYTEKIERNMTRWK
ncbi:MAG: nucleotide pyrophosphohydrolase [bacterium]|nr:nucleotide pyrophosphohydrolase [bacterium]MCM1375967.1 hypothetical protein [Muribaculum sp.]